MLTLPTTRKPYTAGDAAALAPPARGCARVRPVYTGPGEAGENTAVLTTVMKVQVRRASALVPCHSRVTQPRHHCRRRRLELWSRRPAGPRQRAVPAAAQEDRGLSWPACRHFVGRGRPQPRPRRRRRCLYLGRCRTRPLRPRRGHVEPAAAQEDRGVAARIRLTTTDCK